METLYDLLGVRPEDDAEVLRKAFRKAVKANHPDLHTGDPDASLRFRQIVSAYAILRDAEQRAAYDLRLGFEREQHRSSSRRPISYTKRSFVTDAIVVASLTIVLAGGYLLFTHLSKLPIEAAREVEFPAHGPPDAAHRPVPGTDTTGQDEPRDRLARVEVPDTAIVPSAVGAAPNSAGAAGVPDGQAVPPLRGRDTEVAKIVNAFDDPTEQAGPTTAADYLKKTHEIEQLDRNNAQSIGPEFLPLEKNSGAAPKSSSPDVALSPGKHELEAFALATPDIGSGKAIGGAGTRLIKQIGLPGNHRRTTGVAVGDPRATDFAMVQDIAKVLAANPETELRDIDIRVVPTVGRGGLQSVRDVLTLPSTDMAIVNIVLANRLRRSKDFGDIGKGLISIAPLMTEELHVIAPDRVRDIRDLAGKTISLGVNGGVAASLGHDILLSLGIKGNEINADLDASLEGMRSGQIAATFLISGKPVPYLAERTRPSEFHLLAVPYVAALQNDFVRVTLTHDDYPHLIDKDFAVETIGVGATLLAYNWPAQSERFRLLSLFVRSLAKHLPELQSGDYHPKWKQVDLHASIPGWTSFRPIEGLPQ